MVTTVLPPSFKWSDLARRSAEVGDALDEYGEITVTRGAQTLRLAPLAADPIVGAMRDLCRILSALVVVDAPDVVVSVLNAAWPWTRVLPLVDQCELAREAGAIAEVCESLDSWEPFLLALADWRRTARAWADGQSPTGPIGTPIVALASRPG